MSDAVRVQLIEATAAARSAHLLRLCAGSKDALINLEHNGVAGLA